MAMNCTWLWMGVLVASREVLLGSYASTVVFAPPMRRSILSDIAAASASSCEKTSFLPLAFI